LSFDPGDLLSSLSQHQLAQLSLHNLLRPLVRQQLIAQAVGSEAIDEEEQPQLLSQYAQENQLDGPEALEQHLRDRGQTLESLRWQLCLPSRVAKHCEQHFLHKAETRFLERKTQLDQVVYSLLRVKDQHLARELYLRLAGREASFAELAGTYAEGPEQRTQGIVGPVPLTQAHPELAERLRTSTPGTLSEPFAVAGWWLVVRLESYTPAQFEPAVAQQMASELFQEWLEEETTLKLRRLSRQDTSELLPT
jgi:parvulin-like peptidyl-prolyl isomerase